MLDGITTALKGIKVATKNDPSLKYLNAIIAIVFITSLISLILGSTKSSIFGIMLTIIGAFVVAATSKGINNEKKGFIAFLSKIILGVFTLFICTFIGFTISGFAISKPCNWVNFMNIPTKDCQFDSYVENKEEPTKKSGLKDEKVSTKIQPETKMEVESKPTRVIEPKSPDCPEVINGDTPFECLEK